MILRPSISRTSSTIASPIIRPLHTLRSARDILPRRTEPSSSARQQAFLFLLSQVIVNLIKNAAEAMEGQTDARLTLAVARDGERVRLIFADNGPGVAPDVARQLFTPFVTTRANGLGLGLVICRDIVASFGGELDLVPAERGATFVAVLKAA